MTKKKNKKAKHCRREGEDLNLFCKEVNLKVKSLLSPGEHGVEKGKFSDFGLILRTKQKLKRFYCLFEKQFKNLYKIIKNTFANSTDLINFLERRLDNIIYRMNFSTTRQESKQYIIHGYVCVNYVFIKKPSYIVTPGDIITINKKYLFKKYLYDYKKNKKYNWLYLNYFESSGMLLSIPNINLFELNKNIFLDMYK